MKLAVLFLLAAATVALASPLRAQGKLWVALYIGENRAGGPQAPPKLTVRLHEVFGFKFYRLVKGDSVDLAGSERWVLARKDFFLRVRPLSHADGALPRVNYEIYKDAFLVADGAYTVDPSTPLFINGPDFNRGRLIFVLESR